MKTQWELAFADDRQDQLVAVVAVGGRHEGVRHEIVRLGETLGAALLQLEFALQVKPEKPEKQVNTHGGKGEITKYE